MPGFHFPHSLFPGVILVLPEKMPSQIEKAYASPQALFPGEPRLRGGLYSSTVRVRTDFPEKATRVLTFSGPQINCRLQ